MIARGLSSFIAWFVGSLLGVRRAHVTGAMTRAGIAEPEATASAMYRSLARGLLEVLALVFAPWRPLSDEVEIDARALEAVATGRGAVIACAHTGNWDLAACAAAARVPLTVATKHLHIGLFDRLWQGMRARRGVRLVAAGAVVGEARRALARGEAVAMMIDQAPERRRGAAQVDFLGAPAWVDLAPALVAVRAHAPLVVVFSRRRADGSHALELAGVVEPPARASRAWAEGAMRQATRWLEAFVKQNPEQWLWMHRRWKDAATC